MYKEFTFFNEKYIININDISYINMYEIDDCFYLDIYLSGLPELKSIELSCDSIEEIVGIYSLIKNWLIENK